MFVLLVAAEIYGVKHTIELGFPERPSLSDFIGHAEATFRGECSRCRPAHVHTTHRFVIDSVKIFDDTLHRWVDLNSAHQLVEWSQLYLFQPSADASSEESQAILQPPVRIRSPLEVGAGKDKFFFLFHDADFNGNGHLNRDEVQRVFNVMGIFEVSERAIDAMFQTYDTNRDGVLSYAEFSKWMAAAPEVGELLLRKSLEYWQSARQRRPDIRDSSEISAQERAAIEQYLVRCQSSNSHAASASRTRSLREIEDEKLLLEREEELRRARDSFRSTYGRELGIPAHSNDVVRPPSPAVGAAAAAKKNGGGSKAQQQQQQQTTPTKKGVNRTAFGATLPGSTTPRSKRPTTPVASGKKATAGAAAAATSPTSEPVAVSPLN
jgi:hypothetical protein